MVICPVSIDFDRCFISISGSNLFGKTHRVKVSLFRCASSSSFSVDDMGGAMAFRILILPRLVYYSHL